MPLPIRRVSLNLFKTSIFGMTVVRRSSCRPLLPCPHHTLVVPGPITANKMLGTVDEALQVTREQVFDVDWVVVDAGDIGVVGIDACVLVGRGPFRGGMGLSTPSLLYIDNSACHVSATA